MNKKEGKIDKINIDLIPFDRKLILDLHGLTIDEVRVLLDQELEIISNKNIKYNNILVLVLLHGYSKGETLKKYIREEYKHRQIKSKEWSQNPGITYYIIEEDK